MKTSINPVISSRIKNAWAKLSPEQRSRIAPLLQRGHQRTLIAARAGIPPPVDPEIGPSLNLGMAAITGDSDGVVENLDASLVVTVDGAGEIWGTGKYEQLDPGWLEALAEWLEHLVIGKHPFNSQPIVVQVDDKIQIAVAGDWGTGDWRQGSNPSPSARVAKHIALLHPDFTIHLGDVYYAGTADEEQHNLLQEWPAGSKGAFSLNSNHEMYSGGGPYFNAISSPPFQKQGNCSFFALENKYWVIVGLDSAYNADEESLYRDGALFDGNAGTEQIAFLKQQIAKNKKIIILTHHNGLNEDGSAPTQLWSQVMSAFPADAGPDYWYWGHLHAAVVFSPRSNGTKAVLGRCCGHGALPCAQASDLANSLNVLWNENRLAGDPDIPQRIFNGFALLSLDGPDFKEIFYDETGGVAWPASPGGPASVPAGFSRTGGLSSAHSKTKVISTLSLSADRTHSSLHIRTYDGTRQPLAIGPRVLTTISDGSNKMLVRDYCASDMTFNVPFYNNAADNYTVIVYADGYTQAGYQPVSCSPDLPQTVELMLLRKDASFRFVDAQWNTLSQKLPQLAALLAHGAASPEAAADRYDQLMELRPASLACFFNITTAMSAIALPVGNPLQYFKELIWDDTMAQDRFYGWADPALYDQVRAAAAQKTFEREPGFAVFHKGATDSYKQIQFGEANVQLTFHAHDTKVIDGLTCIKMEPDIDYYRQLAAHALLEVISNGISGNLTDPKQVYVLRWIAGRRLAGLPEFDPPYTIG